MSEVSLIEVLFSFSSWDDIIVRVKLLVYDVWFSEDDKTGFLSVGMNISDRLYLKELPISFLVVTMIGIKQIYDK